MLAHIDTLLVRPFRVTWRILILAFGEESIVITDDREHRNKIVCCLAGHPLPLGELRAAYQAMVYPRVTDDDLQILVDAMARDGEIHVIRGRADQYLRICLPWQA